NMLTHPEIVQITTDIHEVLTRVFSRPTERFYEDVLVVNKKYAREGLIPVDTLIQLQNRMLAEKIKEREDKESVLREQKAKLESVTDQLEAANTELSRARDEALEGTRLKSEFLANMSHEIRTPMNGIVGMISLLKETELSEEQQHFATTVQKSADSLLNIINDILDFSKIEAGKLEIAFEETPIRDLIEESVQILAEAAANKQLELILDIDADVPDWVPLDPLRYRQVLTNLLGNAIKFTDKGEVTVKITLHREVEQGFFLRTVVQDSGIGISADNQAQLFQAFIQGDGSTNRKYGGTGLGLAISRKLVTLMEGELFCDSELGEGSQFWFDLPIKGKLTQESYPDVNEMPAGLRALVIDDHAHARDVTCRQVALLGIMCQTAASGSEGLRAIREAYREGAPFDYLLLDLEMPEMDGLEVCKQIALDADLDPLRVILLTTVGQSSSMRKLNVKGVNKTLYKPLSPSDLKRTLHTLKPELPASQLASPAGRKTEEEGLPLLEPMRILLAEDSATNQEVA
ncbi:MAG: ATP-binding protein, partial [Verrucomicrobiota bacterium]